MAEACMGQWAKRRSFQRWDMTQRPEGSGQGRCDVLSKISGMDRYLRGGCGS